MKIILLLVFFLVYKFGSRVYPRGKKKIGECEFKIQGFVFIGNIHDNEFPLFFVHHIFARGYVKLATPKLSLELMVETLDD